MRLIGAGCEEAAPAHRRELGLGREGLQSASFAATVKKVTDFPTVEVKEVTKRRLKPEVRYTDWRVPKVCGKDNRGFTDHLRGGRDTGPQRAVGGFARRSSELSLSET